MSSWLPIAVVLDRSKREYGELAARQLLRRFDKRLLAEEREVACRCVEAGESAEVLRTLLVTLQQEYPEIEAPLGQAARAVARAQRAVVAEPSCGACGGEGRVTTRRNPLGRIVRLRFSGERAVPLLDWLDSWRSKNRPLVSAIVDPLGRWWEPQCGGLALGWERALRQLESYRRHVLLTGEYQ